MSHFKKSVGFALNGIRHCFSKEAHFKVHFLFAIGVIAAGVFLEISTYEWLIILVCIGSVLAAELINTAIETLSNIVHKEKHEGIRQVKDMAAAAVLIMAISAAVCGTVIFIPKIISFVKSMIE